MAERKMVKKMGAKFCRTSFGKCCFTVYSIFTFICSLILGTGRCHYPDFTDVETVAHKGLVTCPESPNEFRAEPDSNPAPSTMSPVVQNVWKAGCWRRGKTRQESNSNTRHLGQTTRLKHGQNDLLVSQHGGRGLWAGESGDMVR